MNNFKFANNKIFKILLPIFMVIIFIFFFNIKNNNTNYENKMLIHYIDVGQGDCILIQVNNKNLLIDSGPSSNRKSLLDYLENLNIKKLDYLRYFNREEYLFTQQERVINILSIKFIL